MEASFWHERWELNQIGFHNDDTNPLLINHLDKLNLDKGARLFLPLCGKTVDFVYLMNLGYVVVGVELSEKAIIELFKDLKLTPTISSVGKLTRYQATNIEIFVGDFFDLNSEILGVVDAIYDRASLVALPETMRQDYTQHLSKITNTIKQLVVCLEYNQSQLNGPPFAINPDELKNHYQTNYSLECVERNEIEGGLKGKTPGHESAWILSEKN